MIVFTDEQERLSDRLRAGCPRLPLWLADSLAYEMLRQAEQAEQEGDDDDDRPEW